VDSSEQMTVLAGNHVKRHRRSVEEKRRIVEETLKPGVSVARVAQRHAINANQIFAWRKRYREGRLGSRMTAKLLPVAITDERLAEAEKVGVSVPPAPLGIIEMVLPKGKLRIEGRVELVTLRAVIECLL
jgi:transposase